MRTLPVILLLTLSLIACKTLKVSDPHAFDEEIQKLTQIEVAVGEETVVFTGSSSVRFWETLADDCSGMKTINTGFGGSQMSDLLFFIEETVLRFKPAKVYIYEGDNDIANDKDPKDILKTTKRVTKKILDANPDTKIVYISAKPSPSRWSYAKTYVSFNTLLKAYCESHEQLSYVNVWDIMIADNGRPKPHIFVDDSLHMNRQGYLLWKQMICPDPE